MPANKAFFTAVRPLFGGRLKQHQVEGLTKIVEYGEKWGYTHEYLAYILATIEHETASWMQPIREGAQRFGPNYSDASARRAVASIHAKGIIRTNYALPTGPFGQSYYGRGLVQITWLANYEKFEKILGVPLVSQPDLALDWAHSLDIVFLGMRDGLFTGKKLSDYTFPKQYKQARVIVNGDSAKRWGGPERIDDRLARKANVFLAALRASGSVPVVKVPKDTPKAVEATQRPENPVPVQSEPKARPVIDWDSLWPF